MFKKLWNKIVALFVDEFVVTIYFPGDVVELQDGSKKTTYNPKTYSCKRVKLLSETQFRLFLTNGQVVNIKTVEPVGFDIVKIK